MVSEPQTTRQATGKPGESAGAARLVAVIDIGATSIRMAIAEIHPDGRIRTLDRLAQGVGLGKDTFTRGAIDSATTEQCVRVLKSYRQVLDEYDISRKEQIHVVATSAVREAANRLSFLKRIYVATGFHVEPFDEAAVNRVTYLGVRPLLESDPELARGKAMVIEVGGGSTELLLIDSGDVVYAQTHRLGALRIRKTLEAYHAPTGKVRNIMESQIQRILRHVRQHVAAGESLTMIALGGDVRLAASQLQPDWDAGKPAAISVNSLARFADQILSLSVDEVVHRYHLAFPEAEAVGPALLAYGKVAHALGLDDMLVSNVNLRDGLIKEMASHHAWTSEFADQIVRSAVDLGRRFHFDEAHGRHVAMLAKVLFHELQADHQLDARFEVILHIAALLHDVGYAVNSRSHHKHSMYLISNCELFGFSRKDVHLVALTARYHRRASPKPTHEGYAALDWESRTNVAKMAAILRVADALDRSNQQHVKDIFCSRADGRLVISVPSADDLAPEQLALRQKGGLFKEIFGMPVLLRNTPES